MLELTNRPPGPRAGRRRGEMARYDWDRLDYLWSCLREYGEAFSFDRRTVVINSPI